MQLKNFIDRSIARYRDAKEGHNATNTAGQETKGEITAFSRLIRKLDDLSSNKNYDLAKKVVATTGTALGIVLFLNAVREYEGFSMTKNTLSDTMDNGISFSLGTFVCGISTVLLSDLLRKQDPDCALNDLAMRGIGAMGYSVGAIGVTKWVLKDQHDLVAGIYFIGSPMLLFLSGIDELRHKSKPMGAFTLAAGGAAALSFLLGYNKKENTVPAIFEATHAASLALWTLGAGVSKLLLPAIRERVG